MPEPLELITIANNLPGPCREGSFCANGPSYSLHSRCVECRLSSNPYLGAVRHFWKPISHTYTHPVLEKEKREAKRAKTIEREKARKAKDPTRQARLRKAERAERKTNSRIIKATRNSGRVNRDGDHLLFDTIVLDTKLQSTAENPVVHLHELDKVRNDAKRNQKAIGALCLQNRSGRAVIVIEASDFARLNIDQRKNVCKTDGPECD